MSAIDLLQSVSIFAETPTEALLDLVDHLDEVEYGPDQTVFTEGEWGTSIYIIIEGRVRVHRDGRTLTEMKRNDVFGEMAALNLEPRSASVTAIERTRLFRLNQDRLFALCKRHPDVFYALARNLSQHLQTSVRNLAKDFLYIQQVNYITNAAANVEQGIYEPETLNDVAQRGDELGQLARVFQRMMREVHSREQQLQQEVHQLRIEIDKAKSQQQVQQIVETDFFLELQSKVHELRNRRTK
jgi:CRP/FNR family transcriptional regulator, cyclic AMP receptor protein